MTRAMRSLCFLSAIVAASVAAAATAHGEMTETAAAYLGGLTTGNAPFSTIRRCPLNLAVTRMSDRNGNIYGGKIVPDVSVASHESDDLAADAVVGSAARWLDERCSR